MLHHTIPIATLPLCVVIDGLAYMAHLSQTWSPMYCTNPWLVWGIGALSKEWSGVRKQHPKGKTGKLRCLDSMLSGWLNTPGVNRRASWYCIDPNKPRNWIALIRLGAKAVFVVWRFNYDWIVSLSTILAVASKATSFLNFLCIHDIISLSRHTSNGILLFYFAN